MIKFTLEIITPQRQVFAEEVEMVSAPTSQGVVGILAHHVPLFASLVEGEIKISTGQKESYLAIGGGFMEVTQDKVSILVSRAVNADELNEAEIKKAEEAARQVIAHKGTVEERSQAQSILRRSLLELKVYRRRGNRRSPSSPPTTN